MTLHTRNTCSLSQSSLRPQTVASVVQSQLLGTDKKTTLHIGTELLQANTQYANTSS